VVLMVAKRSVLVVEQLLDYGAVQPKHSEGKVKHSADIINFKIPRGWKKDQSRGNENIPRVYTFSGYRILRHILDHGRTFSLLQPQS
jgi:hypothetical protein